MSGKNLDQTNLAGSDLSDADLSNASLRYAHLKGAKLARAKLVESDLHGAHLGNADLTDADLRNADLTNTDLHGVDLQRAANLEGVRLAGARGVEGELAVLATMPAEQVHLERQLEQVARLDQEIDRTVRSLFGQRGAEPTDDDRRAVLDAMRDVRRHRDALEEDIMTDIEDGMALHPGSTVEER